METVDSHASVDLKSIRKYDRMFFGHPLGLLILSVNEVWERFSFYGMKAILVLFMVAEKQKGGMGMSYVEAGAIYGLYSSLAATMILPGGWISDILWGPRKALLIGGLVIMAGHLSMVLEGASFFFAGLGLIILGTGLLKPASTVMVSQLYPANDPRQDSGYTIYYMCINIGALLGPLVCGFLAYKVSWHAGFGAAAVGMLLGVTIYVWGSPLIGEVGRPPASAKDPVLYRANSRKLWLGVASLGVVVASMVGINLSGIFVFTFGQLVQVLGAFLVVLPIVYFGYLFKTGRWTRVERNHLIVIVMLFFFSIFFWAASDQRGSLLMLFANQVTDCRIGSFSFPAAWFTAVNPALIILFTPLFAWLWPALGRRNPSTPAKFAWAMFFTVISFAVLIIAAVLAGPERNKVGPEWLLMHMFFVTVAEMFLSPVGISAFARLAPQSIRSQVMGVWFLRGSLAGLMAGAAGSAYEEISLVTNFTITTAIVAFIGVLIVLLTPMIRRLMASADDEVSSLPR